MSKLRSVDGLFSLVLLFFGGACLFERFFSATPISFYDDDAFYYIDIARHLVHDHRSTFDGIHITNGYHPLWMLVLVILASISTGKWFFALLQAVSLASLMSCFLLARAIFRQMTSALVANLGATIIALECLLILRAGMEVILTLPLGLLLCWYRLRPEFRWTASSAFVYGLIGSLFVLSRLDAIILVALLFFFDLIFERPTSKRLGILRMGTYVTFLIPVAAYLISNHIYFGTWTTVSAQAKQLRWHHTPNLTPLLTLVARFRISYRLLVSYPAIALIAYSFFVLLRRPNASIKPAAKAVILSLLFSPVLELLALSIISDWALWTWYLYLWILAVAGSLLLLFTQHPDFGSAWSKGQRNWIAGAALATILVATSAESFGKQQNRWYLYAKDVQVFSSTHPGVYAMGDCAGTTAYLIDDPLIQTEGLVMDESYLDNIRRQRDLLETLRSYGVRYYVTISAKRLSSCYQLVEPIQAGGDSPHMRAILCQAPAASYPHGHATVSIFDLSSGGAS